MAEFIKPKGERIDIPFIELKSERKNPDVKYHYITLYPNHIVYHFSGYFSFPSDEEEDEYIDTSANERFVCARNQITRIGMIKCVDFEGVWEVIIDFKNFSDHIAIQFPSQKEAKEFYVRMERYFLETLY